MHINLASQLYFAKIMNSVDAILMYNMARKIYKNQHYRIQQPIHHFNMIVHLGNYH